jgi:beta-glucanase (GH16 family)
MILKKIPFLLITAGFCCLLSCQKDSPAEPLPEFSVFNTSHVRKITNTLMRVDAVLSKATSQPVSVAYSVVAGTATTNRDFKATTGTVTFPANQTTAYFEIPIIGDSLRQADLSFTIQFSDFKNCTVSTPNVAATIVSSDGTYLPTDDAGYTTPKTYPNYKLVWSDEFVGSEINGNSWNFEAGNNNGWGNAELQNYTNRPQNVFLSKGNLIIEARKESLGGFNYTSARMTTKGKRFFTFGRIDIRAKLPVSKGMWPALWMLGENISTVNWPACGEIDIMELVGSAPNRVTGTAHWGSSSATHTYKGADYFLPTGEDFSQKFHVFSIVWEKDIIKWYVDDKLFYTNTLATVSPAAYPFNANQFFIFNVAVGGNWPGSPDSSTPFPQRMFVDYVRVFQ